jgi:dipeptidyl aminopeptidase/acylaminoacyl peptidase
MEKTFKLIALLAAVGLSMAACATTGGGSAATGGESSTAPVTTVITANTDPKSVRITGITDPAYTAYKTSSAWLMVVPEGSVTGNNPFGQDVASSSNSPTYIATLPANTLAFGLFKSDGTRWTESGIYDLWLLEGTSTLTAAHKYKAGSINISTASVTVDFNKFTKVE